MKTLLCLLWGLAMGPGFAMMAVAEEANSYQTTNETPAALAVPVVPPLAPGVADVAKMAEAKVGDSIILAYINNSGTVYNLDAAQIIYLHDTGVSQTVISAMLDQRQKYMEQPASAPPQSASPPAAATDYSQPETTYVQSAPAPVSTVYVIPYNGAGYGYGGYNYFPFYSCYYPRYPVYYNRFAYRPFRSTGFAVGFHFSTPQHFVAGGNFQSMGGPFHSHR